MTIKEQIWKAVQDILDTLPNYQDKVYLLEDYKYEMKRIEVMYDSHASETKQIYIDEQGVYINGRTTSGEGKFYFKDFNNFNVDKDTANKVIERVEYLKSLKDSLIPSKDIQVGSVIQDKDNINIYHLYIGSYKKNNKTYHVYENFYNCESEDELNMKLNNFINTTYYEYMPEQSNKERTRNIIKVISKEDLLKTRKRRRSLYDDELEWIN